MRVEDIEMDKNNKTEKDTQIDGNKTIAQTKTISGVRASDNYLIFVIFGAYLFSILQITVLAPILPGMLGEIERGEGFRFGRLNQSSVLSGERQGWWAGLILTSGGVAEMITIPIGVKLARIVGHQKTLYLSSLLEVCGCIILAFSVNLPMLFVGRIVQSIGITLLDITGSAMLASRFDDKTRPRAFATAFNGIPLGYVISAIAGTVLYQYLGYTITFTCIAVFGTFEAAIRFSMKGVGKPSEDKQLTELEAYKALVTNMVPIVCLYFGFLMSMFAFVVDSTAPDDVVNVRGGTFWQIGTIIAISTLLEVLAQHLSGFLGGKYGFKKFMFIGQLSISVGLIIYAWIPGVWLTVITFIFQKVGNGFIWPAVGCFLSKFVEQSGQKTTYEHVFGLQTVTKVLGVSLGSLSGALLRERFGIEITYWSLGALCFISAFTVCFMIKRRTKEKTRPVGFDNHGLESE